MTHRRGRALGLVAVLAILSVAVLGAQGMLPIYLAAALAAVVILLLVVLDVRSNPMIPRMAMRNSIRRPAMTALVVGGLMVGTAVISSSFVINDTLDNMIVTQAGKAFGEVDLAVAAPGNGYEYFDDAFLGNLTGEIRGVQGVAAAHSIIIDTVAGQDPRTGLSVTALQAIGAEESAYRDFGGLRTVEGSSLAAPQPGVVYLNQRGSEDVGASVGDKFLVLRGNRTLELTVGAITDDSGLAGYNDRATAMLSTLDLEEVVGHPGELNIVIVSLVDGASEARGQIEEILSTTAQGTNLAIVSDKQEAIDSTRDFLQMFVALFFVFGAFSVIAGTALIISLFSILGEERKSELGVLRAVGLSRLRVRRLFMYEGAVYAILASAVGVFAGVGLAYVIAWFMAMVSSLTGMQLLPYFAFKPSSLIVSFLLGVSVTLVTTYVVVSRIARLNIVRAMRDAGEARPSRSNRRGYMIGAALFCLGAGLISGGVMSELLILANTGLSLVGLSVGFLSRGRMGDRWAWTIAGVVTILPWLPLPGDNRLFPYPAPTEIFVPAGLFMVTASLLVIMFNSDVLIAATVRLFGGKKEYRAVIRTAMSYPLRARFRTALSIFIFGLVIFTVTTLTVVSGLVGINVSSQIIEASGGFDIVAQAAPATPVQGDPWEIVNASDSLFKGENATVLLAYPTAFVGLEREIVINGTLGRNITRVVGVDGTFFEQGSYPLASWDRERFATEEEAWRGIVSDPSLAMVDGSLGGGVDQNGVMAQGEDPLGVGDPLFLVTPGGIINLTVAGVMKQSVLLGVFVSEQTVKGPLGASGVGLMLIRLAEGLDAGTQATLIERTLLPYSVQAIAVADLAKESARTIDGMFALGRGYLALGLIIGIIGLGVITMRNIRERRTEIGILRAIGYRRGMVISNFVLESAVVSILGILIGTIMGVLVGYQLWMVTLKDSGFSFYLDWWPIMLIDLVALVATLLSVYPAARGANRISPADVLKFE